MNGATTTGHFRTAETPQSRTGTWARHIVLKMLGKIRFGQIILQESGERMIFGSDGELSVQVTIRNPEFYRKVLFGGSIGAGEAYVSHDWETDDLTRLVRIMVLNMELLDRMERGFAWLLSPFRLVSHILKRNSRRGAKKNILSHYDLGNEMYQSFLDPTMMYSAAIYPDAASTLEAASRHKLSIICKKLNLQPTDRVIEIGSGWGGFALYAAKNYGCHVTTTTISDAQYEEAKRRIIAAGLEDKITLLHRDYRDLSGSYDKLVSIEMIEAVGHKYLPEFFRKCGALLKKDGRMLLQAITITDQKYKQYISAVDFIQRHIFPGGCIPSNHRMMELLASQTDMVVRHLEDFGFDYARTIRDWRTRFNRSFSSLKDKGYDETFRRLWEFYLCYCEGGFLERSISVVQLVATRPANRISS